MLLLSINSKVSKNLGEGVHLWLGKAVQLENFTEKHRVGKRNWKQYKSR